MTVDKINPNATLMRSNQKVRMVREEIQSDGKTIKLIDAFLPIGRRDAHEQGRAIRPRPAHRIHYLKQQAGGIVR